MTCCGVLEFVPGNVSSFSLKFLDILKSIPVLLILLAVSESLWMRVSAGELVERSSNKIDSTSLISLIFTGKTGGFIFSVSKSDSTASLCFGILLLVEFDGFGCG